mmetsp:Transcript_27292/g.49757  ORF Transcript_27292/g.49757 Transcript_27292/m.49757 type:complete len:209 (+) Transcript_27292:927-1553(+)
MALLNFIIIALSNIAGFSGSSSLSGLVVFFASPPESAKNAIAAALDRLSLYRLSLSCCALLLIRFCISALTEARFSSILLSFSISILFLSDTIFSFISRTRACKPSFTIVMKRRGSSFNTFVHSGIVCMVAIRPLKSNNASASARIVQASFVRQPATNRITFCCSSKAADVRSSPALPVAVSILAVKAKSSAWFPKMVALDAKTSTRP